MVEYGCNVTNKYGFMSDDDEFDDPQALITKVAQHEADKLAAQKKAEKAAAAAAKAAPAPATPVAKDKDAKPAGKENRPAGGERGGRGGRGVRGGRGGASGAPRTPREDDRFGEHGSGGRGRGAPRGRGGDRGERPHGDREHRDRGEHGENRGEHREGGRGRGGPRPFRGGRGGNANHTPSDDQHQKDTSFEEHNTSSDAVAPEEGGYGGRGGRGGRGFRGGAGGNFRGGRGGGFRGNGRQFDRQSGSDIRGGDKKEGHGKGNWGTTKDELAGETEPTGEAVEVKEVEPPVPREPTAEELALEAERAELAKQKTLKEFKAALVKEEPKFNVRKAGEGASENFGKLRPLKKEIIDDKGEEVVVIRRESRKQVLNIDIQFTDPNRDRNRGGEDRGDRRGGADRGGDRPRGRGGNRGGRGGRGGAARSSAPAFDVASEAFPALGAK